MKKPIKAARKASPAKVAQPARTARPATTATKKPDLAPVRRAMDVSATAVLNSKRRVAVTQVSPFSIPKPPPGVLPKADAIRLAMDSQPGVTAAAGWAGGYYGWAFTEGIQFLGYPYLAELAQRPEYRRIVEVIATEMTRKWIKIHSSGDKSKSDKVSKIEAEMTRLEVQRVFKTVAEQDGFFGRGHLYIDTGDTDDINELQMPIGDGRDESSKKKFGKGKLQALRAVEAVWTYPTNYNSNDPLKGDWYKPDMWFVMGKRIHASRFLPFIGREVPDLLKPAYSFGGLSLTQMAKPYVDNWLETRQSVNDAISAYSVMVLSTNMSETLQVGGEMLDRRIEIFNNYRNNRGTMAVDKADEDLKNVAAPLGTLDLLQAQAQEHLASVSGIPLVKLLGVTPSGLNASSDGEIRSFYDWIAAYQKALFQVNLTRVLSFIQLSLFGEVDEDITFEFEPLWALNEKEQAEVEKLQAETAQIRIDSGVVDPSEERRVVADDPDSRYHGLDPEDAPNLLEEEEQGLEIPGGRSELQTTEVEASGGKSDKEPPAREAA